MSNLVTVACRLPHGLVAEVGKYGADDYRQQVFNGPFTKNSQGNPASLVVDGYAFTKVPVDFWNQWLKEHRRAAYIVNRMVYAEDSDDKAQAEAAKSVQAGSTGFEPLDPNKKVNGIEMDAEHFTRARGAGPGAA